MLVVKVEHKGVCILPQSSPVQVRAATPAAYLKLAFYLREGKKQERLELRELRILKFLQTTFFVCVCNIAVREMVMNTSLQIQL